MLVKDNIYGSFEIKEKVLLELIKSSAIQRLKDVSQFGVPDKYYSFKGFSRYEHSVGVMLLLRKLDATIEEQIAGLLHDVSVLAFSHITDWVFGKGRKGVEDYHNSIHEQFVKQTEVPKIIKKHKFVIKRILNEENFGLLERNAPDLCADRVDYALREFKYWLNPKAVNVSLKSLINYKNEIIFDDVSSAYVFASSFLKLQKLHWGAADPVNRYSIFF
jgi:HD superfamily phosphohydrolase